MAVAFEVSCGECGLGPNQVLVGPLMADDFFHAVGVWCRHCECISSSDMFVGVRAVQEMLRVGRIRGHATKLPASRHDLAALLLSTHRRSSCESCGRRARRLRMAEGGKPPNCPKCTSAPLRISVLAIVD
jgi:hypothetical protein